ncbi:hypothetical protein Taro_019960 [Colocasia esculenta]|uniref:Uncharacterized protein n=1 Tax=Colocasia esculenta TaxID=4460 RepID=A0A843V3S5_COLES|nr:hypothetical protein [Colocasia esculenta]
MGNCMRVQPAECGVDDDGEYWEWAEGDHRRRHLGREFAVEEEKVELLMGDGVAVQAATAGTEVRIKLSRRKLEELLGKADAQRLPLGLVLARMAFDMEGRASLRRGRHWRPALHNIPEVAE